MSLGTRRVLAILWIALCGGCSGWSDSGPSLEPGEIWKPVRRFARGGFREVASPLPPTATLGDDTRPSPFAKEPFTLNYSPSYSVPPDGRVALRPRLPDGVETESLLVEIRVRAAERWVALPGRLLPTYSLRGRQRVDIELDLTESANDTVGIWVTAQIPQTGRAEIDFDSTFLVSDRSRLGFAIGVADVAAGQGPVEFSVSACIALAMPECISLFRAEVDPTRPEDRGWLERSVGLDAVTGREVTLRFATSAVGNDGAGDGKSLPFWGDPTLFEPAVRGSDAPNLILLSIDTLRADHMGAYGYPRDTTPFIDAQLAAAGTLFERYIAAASSTRPSHMTMFTSLPPSVHGATENAGVRTLPAGAITLAELLSAAGLSTAAITENGAIDRSRGFGRGFGVYVENRDSQSADMRTGHIEQTFAQGLAWLDRNADERFFLFLHSYQVHNPFTPPPAYAHYFSEPEPDLAPPPALRSDWDPLQYDREIRYMDDQVRALVESLSSRGLLENTILVLTSDHGEAFLEHGFVAHGANVHAEVLNVPLIFIGPGVPAGRRIAAPMPMLDLMPTLLDLLRVAPGGQEMGRSRAAVVRGGDEPGNAPLRAIYGEAWATRAVRARSVDTLEQPSLSLELGFRKLIRSHDGGDFSYELYDTKRDPHETVDLYAAEHASAADLREMLTRYEQRMAALHDALGEEERASPALDPLLEEKLRALGYID